MKKILERIKGGKGSTSGAETTDVAREQLRQLEQQAQHDRTGPAISDQPSRRRRGEPSQDKPSTRPESSLRRSDTRAANAALAGLPGALAWNEHLPSTDLRRPHQQEEPVARPTTPDRDRRLNDQFLVGRRKATESTPEEEQARQNFAGLLKGMQTRGDDRAVEIEEIRSYRRDQLEMETEHAQNMADFQASTGGGSLDLSRRATISRRSDAEPPAQQPELHQSTSTRTRQEPGFHGTLSDIREETSPERSREVSPERPAGESSAVDLPRSRPTIRIERGPEGAPNQPGSDESRRMRPSLPPIDTRQRVEQGRPDEISPPTTTMDTLSSGNFEVSPASSTEHASPFRDALFRATQQETQRQQRVSSEAPGRSDQFRIRRKPLPDSRERNPDQQ